VVSIKILHFVAFYHNCCCIKTTFLTLLTLLTATTLDSTNTNYTGVGGMSKRNWQKLCRKDTKTHKNTQKQQNCSEEIQWRCSVWCLEMVWWQRLRRSKICGCENFKNERWQCARRWGAPSEWGCGLWRWGW